jgi:DNA-binding response OmpR family regulator
MKAGASRFLTKPFQPETIVAEARSLLGTQPAVAS